jgi:hypothetical protein
MKAPTLPCYYIMLGIGKWHRTHLIDMAGNDGSSGGIAFSRSGHDRSASGTSDAAADASVVAQLADVSPVFDGKSQTLSPRLLAVLANAVQADLVEKTRSLTTKVNIFIPCI